ncbi:MAG: ankyrin repeat domain-containing protein [Myxococcota bacterium]
MDNTDDRAKHVYDEILTRLDEAGASATTDSSGRDALFSALRLLERDDPRRSESLGDAASAGDVERVRAYLADGQHPDEPYREGFYPIERAFQNRHEAVVELLLAAGAVPRNLVRDPEQDARREKHRKLRAELEAQSEPPPPRVADGPSRAELERKVATLIEAGMLGPEPAATRVGNDPILCFAAKHGLTPVVEALLKLDVPADGPQAPKQLSPLVLAARGGHTDTCRALLAAGADPSLSGDTRFVPLTYAAELGDLELVQRLVEAGANLEFVGDGGQTPVNRAAGPQRNAIRYYLRQHRREALLRARAPAIVFKRRKRMHTPKELYGIDDYGQFAPSAWPRWALRADADAVCDALEASTTNVAVERTLGTAPMLAAHRFAIVFQLEGSDWTMVSAEGVTPTVAGEYLSATAKHLSALACGYRHRLMETTLEILEPGAEDLRKIEPDSAEAWLRETRLWIPPHHVEGSGPDDLGWYNHLRLHGLRSEHLAAAHRIVWQW